MKKNKFFDLITNPIFISAFLLLLHIFISSSASMGNDEGIWSYIGRIWAREGIPPYLGAVENKTPGIFGLYAISDILFGVNLFFVRGLGLISILITSLIIYLIGREIHSLTAGVIGMYIFGLTTSWELLNGSLPGQTETFMILFSTLSFYFLMKGMNNENWKIWIFISGISMGFAIAFKQIALTTTGALFLFFILNPNANKERYNVFVGLILMITGIGISTFLSILPLLLSGVSLKLYLEGAWLILFNEGSAVGFDERLNGFLSIWGMSNILVFYPFILLMILRTDLIKNKYLSGLLAWLLLDFTGVNLSGYYYGHQIKQLIPPLAIITGILLSNLLVNLKRSEGFLSNYASWFVLSIVIIWLPYQALFTRAYRIAVSNPDPKKEIGLWLRDHTSKKDPVYLLGSQCNQILSYSERISSSKYFNAIFLTSNKEREVLMKELEEITPHYILKPHYPLAIKEMKNIGETKIEKFIADFYHFFQSRNGWDIYVRNSKD